MEELLADHVTSLNAIHLGAAATRISQLYIQLQQQQQKQQQQGSLNDSPSYGTAPQSDKIDAGGGSIHSQQHAHNAAQQVVDDRQLQRLMSQLERFYAHALPQLEARYAGVPQPVAWVILPQYILTLQNVPWLASFQSNECLLRM